MRSLSKLRLPGLIAAGGLALAVALSGPAAAANPQWKLLTSLDGLHSLDDVAMISATDGWAVGSVDTVKGKTYITNAYLTHWDGKKWAEVPVGDMAGKRIALESVSASGPHDVWAVGSHVPDQTTSTGAVRPADRGAARRPVRAIRSGSNRPVAGRRAAPRANTGTPYAIAHYAGRSWSHLERPTPPAGWSDYPNEVKAFAPDNVWVAGYEIKADPNTGELLHEYGFVEHWNGKQWQRLTLPAELTGHDSVLARVRALGPNDIWLCGWLQNLTGGPDTPLLLHWDGRAFTVTRLPLENLPAGWDAVSLGVLADNSIYVAGVLLWEDHIDSAAVRWDGRTWGPIPNLPMAIVNTMDASTKTGRLLIGGWQSKASAYSNYAEFDGRTWTVYDQPDKLGRNDGQVVSVRYLPGTGTAFGTGYADTNDRNGSNVYVTRNR